MATLSDLAAVICLPWAVRGLLHAHAMGGCHMLGVGSSSITFSVCHVPGPAKAPPLPR